MSRSALLLLVVVGGGLASVQPVPALAGPPAAPAPADPDPVAEATRLRDEAKELFKQAGDTDAENSERSKARKECFKMLKQAKKALDDHLAANPSAAERIDPLYCDVASMMFWLKKEMTLEEIREVMGGAPPAPKPPDGAPGPAGPPGPGGGGIGGAGSRTPPSPPPGGTGGGTGGGPATGTPPAVPPTPEPPKGPSPADVLAEVERYAKDHPGDVPGVYEQYEAFLASFPDPSTDEYGRAVQALKALDDRMKDVYRLARDDDPDALRGGDEAEVRKRMKQLLDDLASTDEKVRVRAAKYLGLLGSPAAAQPLLDVLRAERSGAVADAAADALAEIGGKRVFDKLLQTCAKDKTLVPSTHRVCTKALAKGGPSGRVAGEALASLGPLSDESERAAALEALVAAGAPGAVGLARATATWAPDDEKTKYLEHLATLKDPRTAADLARFLVVNPSGRKREHASIARDAITSMGKGAVRHLIPALDDAAVQLWTAEMLRQITGTKLKDDKRKTWEAWFRKNRRSLEGG